MDLNEQLKGWLQQQAQPGSFLDKAGLGLAQAGQTIGQDAGAGAAILNDPRNSWIGMNPLGMAVGGGLGLVGMLAGPLSKTANLAALKEAQSLLGAGEHMSSIWKKTGWFQGPEGGWRYEIPDKAASLLDNIPRSSYDKDRLTFPMMEGLYKQPGIENRTLGLTLDHPELYKAYPELQQVPVQGTGLNLGLLGAYDEEAKKMFLAGGFPENVKSTALHEAQHAIQGIEDFPRGGNSNMFLPSEMLKTREDISKSFHALKDVIQKDIPSFNYFTVYGALNKQSMGKDLYDYERKALDLVNQHPQSAEFYELLNKKMQLDKLEDEAGKQYRALAGEVESRLVQKRADYTDEMRQMVVPSSQYDVPVKEQIIRKPK
jgi:hypothetical protein